MADLAEFLSTTDKPALVAITSPIFRDVAISSLQELGYKVHTVDDHTEFPGRFASVQYQAVIIEDKFGDNLPENNTSLKTLQRMPMALRRHITLILLSETFETMNALLAFQQSVHAIVNYNDVGMLTRIIQKTVSDNELFLTPFREAQKRVVAKR
jgi:hypothetical protein